MKALVTGANGLIGANLLRALHRGGHDAVALVRPTSNVTQIAQLPGSRECGDVRDLESLRAPMKGCEVVFHTAVHFSYWGHASAELHDTAIEGTRNILLAARDAGVRRVVVTSSTVTLGASAEPVVRDETSLADPSDSGQAGYVAAKIAQEAQATQFAKEVGVEVVFALPAMSVGAFGSSLGPSNGLIASYLADPLKLTWRGGCNIVAVEDVADGHVLIAERGAAGARYVLGSENLTWPDIHGRIARLAGVEPPRIVASAMACRGIAIAEEARALLTGERPLATREQAAMVGRYYWYDHAAAGALGYAPRPAEDALAEAIAWLAASEHIDRETRVGMRLARSVHAARMERQAAELAFTKDRV